VFGRVTVMCRRVFSAYQVNRSRLKNIEKEIVSTDSLQDPYETALSHPHPAPTVYLPVCQPASLPPAQQPARSSRNHASHHLTLSSPHTYAPRKFSVLPRPVPGFDRIDLHQYQLSKNTPLPEPEPQPIPFHSIARPNPNPSSMNARV
jgi:hypothetical protein